MTQLATCQIMVISLSNQIIAKDARIAVIQAETITGTELQACFDMQISTLQAQSTRLATRRDECQIKVDTLTAGFLRRSRESPRL